MISGSSHHCRAKPHGNVSNSWNEKATCKQVGVHLEQAFTADPNAEKRCPSLDTPSSTTTPFEIGVSLYRDSLIFFTLNKHEYGSFPYSTEPEPGLLTHALKARVSRLSQGG
jgi:hypothetical protein